MKFRHLALAAAAAVLTTGFAAPAAVAQEVTLRAASAFPKGTFFSRRFESMIETLNEKGKGKFKIEYVGGAPEIGAQTEVIQKVAQGLFDIGSSTGAYYLNVVPEADAWKLLEIPPAELRENGGWDYMEKIHNEKNLTVLARTYYGAQFHLYLSEGNAIKSPDDMKGMHLRVSPIYRNFFRALGATTQDSGMAEIYTLMENRTVAGTGWPITGLQPDWLKVMRYRVDPGFYDPDIQVLMNLRTFNRLPKDAQKIITDVALQYEQQGVEQDAKMVESAIKAQAEAGIKTIELTGADREKWLQTARDAAWEGVIKDSPKHGPKLQEFFLKK